MKKLMGSAIGALALVAMTIGAPHARHDAHAAGATVTVANFQFTDGASGTSTTTINVGDTVTWTWANTSGVPHSTTSTAVPAGAATWDSGQHASPFSFGPTTFTVMGTYTYHCTVHAGMTGTIVVQAAATSTPMAPTSTPVAATSTPMPAASTPPAATSTPIADATMAAATAASAAASPAPALIAPAPASASSGAAGAARAATQTALPRAGSGASGGGSSRGVWLTLALAGSAAAALVIAGGVRLRRRARR